MGEELFDVIIVGAGPQFRAALYWVLPRRVPSAIRPQQCANRAVHVI